MLAAGGEVALEAGAEVTHEVDGAGNGVAADGTLFPGWGGWSDGGGVCRVGIFVGPADEIVGLLDGFLRGVCALDGSAEDVEAGPGVELDSLAMERRGDAVPEFLLRDIGEEDFGFNVAVLRAVQREE